MVVSVVTIRICRHKGEELGHYRVRSLRLFNGDLCWKNELEVAFHFGARLVETEQDFGVDVYLVGQFHINTGAERVLVEPSDEKVFQKTIERQLDSRSTLHLRFI